ncbi:MAG: cell division protein FtsL [Deltaproteobacteria bacterium]|jgi:cell division protein FtsL|nr:cell division protein FtsL [Deltaproteobacteria bacterium]
MSLFSFLNKNSSTLSGSISIIEPKWKQKIQAGSKQRNKVKNRNRLEQFQRPENQLLARLPDETLSFLSARNFLVIAMVAVIFFLGLLVFIRVSHSQNELGMEISRLTNYQVQLREENRRLKIELARQASLDDLEIVARRDLGLISPSQGQIIVID